MKPWSKLQREIKKLFDPDLDLNIQCRAYRMDSQRGSTDLPRYWITLGKKVIFDYPKDFNVSADYYPYINDISDISKLIREYIDTPVVELLTRRFDDPWFLTSILLAADRRIGVRRKGELFDRMRSPAGLKVVMRRFGTR